MYQFKTPFRSFLCGPSMSGKTTLLTKIIKNCDKMFVEKPKKIYYCYSIWQESYDKIKAIAISGVQIQFIQGYDVFKIIEQNSWVIIDDLAESIEQWSQEMLHLFTVCSYHEHISVTLVLHNYLEQIYVNTCFELYLLYYLQSCS